MKRSVSPFASLTGAEKQLKWLEYQSIQLPYVHGSVDALPEEPEPQPEKAPEKKPIVLDGRRASTVAAPPTQTVQTTTPLPQPQLMTAGELQPVRHRQYDAVIEKMRQAEARAKGYQSFP